MISGKTGDHDFLLIIFDDTGTLSGEDQHDGGIDRNAA